MNEPLWAENCQLCFPKKSSVILPFLLVPKLCFLAKVRICTSACFQHLASRMRPNPGYSLKLAIPPSRGWSRGSAAGLKLGVTHWLRLKTTKAPSMPMASVSFSHKVYREHRKKQKREPHLSQAVPFLCNAFFLKFYGKYRLAQSPLLILWLHPIAPRQGHVQMDRFSAQGLI